MGVDRCWSRRTQNVLPNGDGSPVGPLPQLPLVPLEGTRVSEASTVPSSSTRRPTATPSGLRGSRSSTTSLWMGTSQRGLTTFWTDPPTTSRPSSLGARRSSEPTGGHRFQAPAWNSWLADHLDQADHSSTIYLLFILNKVISGL